MSEHYDFHYQPTGSGAISGQQVLQQTEDAINELGDYVNDNVGGAMDVAQEALETAQNAEQDAQTALDTANSFSSAIQSAQQDASTALSTAQTAQTTASNAYNTANQASQDANTAVTTANNASGQVSTLSGTVTTLGQRVTTAEGNIGQNTSDITALTTRVGTAEGNITTLQNDVSIAQGNASSAMATAGQVKQQAFVFRYSSTALVASSTNSNTLLDNTDNLKVGDKVIDSDGVLFSITAIDSVNSTFTIGTALVDLAQDSDVVHKTGDETSTGFKQFSNIRLTNSIKGINLENTTTDLNNCYSDFASSDGSRAGNIQYYYCNTVSGTANISNLPETNAFFLTSITTRLTSNSLYVKQILINSNSKTFVRYCNNSTWSTWVNETDSEYVHKSGDETIDGLKKFLKYITSNGSSTGDEYSSNTRTNLWLMGNRDVENVSGILFDTYRQNTAQGTGIHILGIGIKENSVRYEGCRWGWYWDNNLNGYYFDFKPTTQGANQALKHNLGTSTDRWSTINGLEPSSLGMPDLSNGIDISSYITIGDTDNNYYTPPANGWIWAKLIGNGLAITQGDFGINANYVAHTGTGDKWVEACLLVTKDVQATIRCRNITGIIGAKFYPCLGNV